MKHIILSALLASFGISAFAQACDPVPLPYFQQFEEVSADGLPLCTYSTFNTFASSQIFQVSPEAVDGFTGKVAQYDLTADFPQGGPYNLETDFYLGNFLLEENTFYTFSFKYGHSAGIHPVALRAILQAPGWGGFSYLITNMQQMPDENGIINQTIGVPATGMYQLHFNVVTGSADGFVYLDDVRLEEAATAGLDGKANTALTIFPNPVKDILTISHHSTIDSFELYNSIGQVVLVESPGTSLANINLERLAAGVYYGNIRSGSQITNTRVIKE